MPQPSDPAPTRPKVIGFSGSTRRPSKSRALVEAISYGVSARVPVDVEIFDMVDLGSTIGAFSRDDLPASANALLAKIERSDALIVASPVYKGSYAGLFKHVFDLIDPNCLYDRPIVLAATGGGPRHALVVEHQLRPLFGFFCARMMSTAIYASESDFVDGVCADAAILSRVDAAAAQMADAIGGGGPT